MGTTLCVGVIGMSSFHSILFMLMGVGMQHSGIGGGGFMLVRGADGKYESIGKSPLNHKYDLIKAN